MIGYPLDSQVTYEPDGTPIYDRAISSAPLRKLLHELFSDGVLPNPSTNLQVVVGDSGMTVKVNPGFAMVNGCLKLEETQRTLEIQAASSAYDRIDTIVVRLNDEANARICDLYVRQGTPASSPVRPDLVRSGSVYEIGLADVFIPRNTSTIAQQRITDTRYETARCGIISSISQFDTTTLYNQIQSDLAGFKTEEQQQFMDWFENLVYVLDGDVAGHLQNEIDATDARVDEIETQIGDTDISAIGDGKITGAISSLNSTLNNIWNLDSTSPVKIGRYNNKDLYRKYIKFNGNVLTSSSTMQSVNINHNINMSELVDYDFKITNGYTSYCFPYTANDDFATILVSVDRTKINLRNKSSWSGYFIQGYIDFLQ